MTLSLFRKVYIVFRNFKISKMLLGFQWDGYLEEIGWINSYQQQRPVNRNDDPLPWVTYPFIDFITGRLEKSMTLLEYGSGNSTLFYSRLVKKVYTVEHDLAWHKRISADLPDNVTMDYVVLEPDGAYARYATTLGKTVDLVVIDGRDRVNCIKQSVGSLSSQGVLILDDSERNEYGEGIKFLLDRGFKRIDFWGIAPGVFYRKCTTIFYPVNNCLGI